MIRQHSYTVGDAAACSGFEAEFVAVGTVWFLSDVLHGQRVLGSDGIVGGFAVDEFDSEVFGTQLVGTHPGVNFDALAEAELAVAASVGVYVNTVPVLANFLFP